MVHFIVGENASGKTAILYDKYYNTLNDGVGRNSICNIESDTVITSILLDMKLVKEIQDCIYADELYIGQNMIRGARYSDRLEDYSESFYKIISLLAKDVNTIFLDEPEYNLPQCEILRISHVLNLIQNYNHKEIWITTHSIDLIGVFDSELLTPQSGELVEGECLYEMLM